MAAIEELAYNDETHAYWLTLPGGKKRRAKNVSSVAKVPDDPYNLTAWGKRQVAIGLASRPDLVESVAAHWDDKTKLNDICTQASDAADARKAATAGTTAHRITERVDLGEAVLDTPLAKRVATMWTDLLAGNGLTVVPDMVERVVVHPDRYVCGTFDRLVRTRDGRLLIADIKGLATNTPIPTPTGWTTMGALAVGDEVFAGDGTVCRVTLKSQPRWIDCYRVRFDDGSSIICDSEHRWRTHAGTHGEDIAVRTADEIRSTLLHRGQRHHRIPNAGPLSLPPVDLPIDPYVLGCWLGDGKHTSGEITKQRDLFDEIERCGYQVGGDISSEGRTESRTVYGLRKELRRSGLLGHKHIPDIYLRAGKEQRLALLQGLMDTDGTWNRVRHQAVFDSTDKALSHAVYELVVSLGCRATIQPVTCHGFGVTATSYRVPFTPNKINPFRLPRKRNLVDVPNPARSRRRLVVSVDPVPTVTTQCIQVDSVDHTYLCGEQMVPTHNTGTSAINFPHSTAVQLALYANAPFLAARWGSAASGSTRTFTPFGPELDELDRSVGLVLYLPLDEGAEGDATVYEYDLDAAWRCVTDVIWPTLDWRTHDKDQLRYPYEPPAPATTGSDPVEVRRVALLDAVRALPGPARAAIKTAWPASLPPLTAPDGWTAERLEVVDALVALAGGPGTAAVAAEASAGPSPATPWARLSAAERDRRARAGQVPADAQPADETLEQIRGRWSALPVELRLYGAWLTHINGGYWPRHDLTARHWLAETAQAHLGLLDYLEGLTGRLCDTGDVGDEDAKGRWQGRCREHGVTTADAAAHAKTIARALDRPAPRRIADWDDPEIAPRLHAWMLIPPDTTTTTGVEGVDEQRGAA